MSPRRELRCPRRRIVLFLKLAVKSKFAISRTVPVAIFAGLITIAFGIFPAGAEIPYVEPDFSTVLFNTDALSLEGEALEEIVDSLAALARNFPDHPEIDNGTRMKALALALRLDSMHPAARLANDELIGGRRPQPLAPYREAAEIGGFLWETAVRLRDEKREAEDARLARYLMDIAAETDLSKREEREKVLRGAALSGIDWGSIVTLPPKEVQRPPPAADTAKQKGPTATGAPPVADRVENAPGVAPGVTTTEEPAGKDVASGRSPQLPEAGLKRAESALRVVVFEPGAAEAFDEIAVACWLTATVSDAQRSDPENPFYCEEGIAASVTSQLEEAARLLQERHGVIPKSNRIDFRLTSLADGKPLQMGDPRLGATVYFLLDSLLRGVELDPEISIGAVLPGEAKDAAPRRQWWDILEAAGETGAKVVIVESSAEAEFQDHLVAGDFLPMLRIQALHFDAAEEIAPVLARDRDAKLAEALRLFGEVQELESRADAKDLVRNVKVLERFEAVLNSCPQHLSAKLLEAYGTGNVPAQLTLEGSVFLVDAHMKAIARAVNPGGVALIASERDRICTDSVFALRRVRPQLDDRVNPYADAVTDFIDQLRDYLQLANKTTKTGKLQEAALQEQKSKVEGLRSQLKPLLEKG